MMHVMRSIRSVVRVPFMIASRAGEENRAAFICRSELLLVVEDLFVTTFLTRLLDGSLSLHIGL